MPGSELRSTGRQAAGRFWPAGPPGYVLAGLLLAGVGLRLVAVIGWWPTASTLDDGYQLYAESNPFADPQHPAGYGLIVAALGALTREVAVPVLLQHLVGIASALLLFAATRRVARSEWAGLLPAAIVLLNPDQIFLEHSIMSESWAVLTVSVGLYAVVRAFDDPDPWWRWPALAGGALALGVAIRTAGLLAIPVAVLALLLCRPQPFAAWRRHWQAPVAAAGVAAAVLLGFATANATFGDRFGLGPSQGWYLYGRAAQFADCDRFTPPPGTEVLCEDTPASDRQGAYYYLFDPAAPAPRAYGGFGESDELVGEWAKRAIRAQPGDYLSTTWEYLRAYWLSGLTPAGGTNLDPQLDFTAESLFEAEIERSLESFYRPVHGRSRSARARVPPRLAGGVPIRWHRARGDDGADADRSVRRRAPVPCRRALVRDRRPGAAGGTRPDRELRRSLHGADGRSAGRRLGDCAGRALASLERTPRARGPTRRRGSPGLGARSDLIALGDRVAGRSLVLPIGDVAERR